jgi:hypothetical protein
MFSSTEAGRLAAKRARKPASRRSSPTASGTVIANGQHVASDFDWYGMGTAYADWMAENYPVSASSS